MNKARLLPDNWPSTRELTEKHAACSQQHQTNILPTAMYRELLDSQLFSQSHSQCSDWVMTTTKGNQSWVCPNFVLVYSRSRSKQRGLESELSVYLDTQTILCAWTFHLELSRKSAEKQYSIHWRGVQFQDICRTDRSNLVSAVCRDANGNTNADLVLHLSIITCNRRL